MDRPKALVFDEDPGVRRMVVTILAEHGFDAREVEPDSTGASGVDVLAIDLVRGGLPSWVDGIRRSNPGILLVGLGGESSAGIDVFDALAKPIDANSLRGVARRLRGVITLRTENRALLAELQRRASAAGIVGRSDAARELRDSVAQHARSSAPVWFAGEPGVGKEHAARVLHAMSERSGLDFVVESCRSTTVSTGSGAAPLDPFGGTLYLDELPSLPPEGQRRLVRRFELDPAGDSGRIVASAPAPPSKAAEIGRLVDGLRDRFEPNVVVVAPLRERPDDVPVLAKHFADRIGELNRLPAFEIESGALALLEAYPWPGNVAELRTAMEHAALLATEARIGPQHLPETIRGAAGGPSLRHTIGTPPRTPAAFRAAKRTVVTSFEAAYLRELLAYHDGNVTAAARQSGMLRSALQRLLRKHGLRSGEFRDAGHSARSDSRTAAPPVDERG